MKKFINIIFVITIFLIQSAFAQNNAPIVENVTFSQRIDGSFMVDIYYDVTDADGDTMTVFMQVSEDGGSTFFYSCDNITGDVGDSILNGSGKYIIWDFGAEHPNSTGDQFQIKIIADDGIFGWVTVNAGEYTYGEGDTVKTIDYDYQVSKYEITNAQYVAYLEEALANGDITVTSTSVEGYYTGDEHWGTGDYEYLDLDDGDCQIDYNGSKFSIITGYENHPAMEVTWFGANAFAEHFGCSLPTEEEWEKAARGNTGNTFPWGDALDGSRANYYNSSDPYDNGTTPVDYYNGTNHDGFQTTDSPSPYGAYDMAGNVWEWTNSFYGGLHSYYRVVRGGSWSHFTVNLQSWYRLYQNPNNSGSYGFRLSRTY